MIQYASGDLFEVPKFSILIHACNCQGVWGYGVATEFKRRFPLAFRAYESHCYSHRDSQLIGTSLIIPDNGYIIVCLFTSVDYGHKRDRPSEILYNTQKALEHMFTQIPKAAAGDTTNNDPTPLNMPRINSGAFRVPWERTAEVLEKFPDRNFVVWTPPGSN